MREKKKKKNALKKSGYKTYLVPYIKQAHTTHRQVFVYDLISRVLVTA